MKSTLDDEISGREIIERFERILPPEQSFHHRDHVRLAFEYLRECTVLAALARCSKALRRFAEARGKPQLYNQTVTFAYFFLIHERMARKPVAAWDEFASDNPDLMIWKGGALSAYYHEETLRSDLSRRVFLFPDKIGRS